MPVQSQSFLIEMNVTSDEHEGLCIRSILLVSVVWFVSNYIVIYISDTAPTVRTTTTTDGNRDTTQPSTLSSPKTGKFIDILFVISLSVN